MSTRKTNIGTVGEHDHGSAVTGGARTLGQHHDGVPKSPAFKGNSHPGMRVLLTHVKGLTNKHALKHPYRFQMPPLETFSQQFGFTFTDFDTLRAGQQSRPVGVQGRIVTFSTLVVEYDPRFSVWPNHQKAETFDDADRNELWNVLNMTAKLRTLLNRGTPFRLRCGEHRYWEGGGRHGSGWDVDFLATLRNLKVEERAGEPDARYIDVEFHEYRRIHLKRSRFGKGKHHKDEPTTNAPARWYLAPTTVEIFADGSAIDRGNNDRKLFGDDYHASLHRLAKYFYGNPDHWRFLVRRNAFLRKRNATQSMNLGNLSVRFKNGRSYKIKVPHWQAPPRTNVRSQGDADPAHGAIGGDQE